MNGWNPKITQLKRTWTSSSQSPSFGSMLIFQGVAIQPSQTRFHPSPLTPSLLAPLSKSKNAMHSTTKLHHPSRAKYWVRIQKRERFVWLVDSTQPSEFLFLWFACWLLGKYKTYSPNGGSMEMNHIIEAVKNYQLKSKYSRGRVLRTPFRKFFRRYFRKKSGGNKKRVLRTSPFVFFVEIYLQVSKTMKEQFIYSSTTVDAAGPPITCGFRTSARTIA